MYQLLLCWRYLRTRYIALASIISVTLGVATMIVVNSVMSGFTTEMQNRIHGILSDVVVEARSLDGFPDAQWHMDQIYQAAGDSIEEMTPAVVVKWASGFEMTRLLAATPLTHVAGNSRSLRLTCERCPFSVDFLMWSVHAWNLYAPCVCKLAAL